MKWPGVIVVAFLLAACGGLLAACGGSQPTVATGGAVFEISEGILSARTAAIDTLVDLGRIRSGEIVRYDARLRNTGAEPMVVRRINTSCGCTSVEYEKQPIAVGDEGAFSFRFDTRGMYGVQQKLIEIETSASGRPFKIMVRAEVVEQ